MENALFRLKKIIISSTILSLMLFSASSSLAAGITEPTGPSQPTGITQPTGPKGPTGITEPSGPTSNDEIAATEQTPNLPAEPLENTPAQATNENNQTTGPSSNNGNEDTSNSSTTISTDNDADLNNNVNAGLNTGNNTVGSNTVAGNISTGDITGTVNILNLGNSVLGQGSTFGSQNLQACDGNILLSPVGQNQRIDISGDNSLTGPGSTNTNEFQNNNIISVTSNNNADADNEIVIDANTGDNTIENNTSVGGLYTGDINLGVNLINILNVVNPNLMLTVDTWNILGDVNGDIGFANDLTGPDSSNSNYANIENQIDASSIQNADISNNIALNANTGDNKTGNNSLIGNVSTGSTNVQADVTNIANIGVPMFYILNVYGDWDGNYGGLDPSMCIINQINEATGPNSINSNNLNANNTIELALENNAQADNNIIINANTGRNTIQNNTMAGNLSTGDINLSANVVNILNSFDKNVSKFALGVINIFGNWRHPAPLPAAPIVTPTPMAPVAEAPINPAPAENQTATTPIAQTPGNRVLGNAAVNNSGILPTTGGSGIMAALASPINKSAGSHSNIPYMLLAASFALAGFYGLFRLALELKKGA